MKPGSGFDDEVTRRYHFPARSNYLDAAQGALGDWILFREPRRNSGRRAYIATARVITVKRDPERADRYYAYAADYLAFPTPVPSSLMVAMPRRCSAPSRIQAAWASHFTVRPCARS